AQVFGNALVCDKALVFGNALVSGEGAIFCIVGIGSRNGTTTFFACKDKKIRVSCGCFYGNIDEFTAKVRQTHGDNIHAKMYQLAIQMAKLKIEVDS
ncbi:MAG: hypothetical protein KHY89_10510, partial [Butyricicoccus pullicaecorum]|nr:hypothetical protein [Butyricicoccus pullicaecorum]